MAFITGDAGMNEQTTTYTDLIAEITNLLEVARQQASRAVNSVLVVTYWQIGQRIVEQEQHGADRADYGEQLLERLGRDLSAQFGRGFSAVNLRRMRSFYSEFSDSSLIRSTLSTEFKTLRSGPNGIHFGKLRINQEARNMVN
jgi:DUF1016 N-terminal domain